jgi:SAM-dependent methyltransferase
MKVDNKFAGYFYNKFDLPIRLLYSKLHLNKLFFWKFYTSNFEKLDLKFEEINDLLNYNKYTLKNKVFLELGPGNSYINTYNFLMNGAKKVILVDKYSRHIKTKKQKKFFDEEQNFIKNKYKNKKIDFKKISFIPKDLTKIKLKDKVDFVYSISIFEHIKDVEGNIKKLGEIVKKGGIMYHSIDMRDHYNFNNPFLFLKYSKKIWNKYLTKEGVSYTNRIRYSEFKKLFEKYGLEIINEEVERYNLPKNISKEFDKNDKDLDIGIWRVLLRRK